MKTKIAFVIPNLLTGGTQRALVNIAQSLSTEDFEVALIVIHSATKKYGALDTKRIPIDRDCLRVIYLDLNGVKWSIFKLRSLLMKEKPDILFSSLSYLNLYLSFFSFLLPKGIKLVIRETNVLSVKHSFTKYPRFINFILHNRTASINWSTIMLRYAVLELHSGAVYHGHTPLMVLLHLLSEHLPRRNTGGGDG